MVVSVHTPPSLKMWCVHDVHNLEGHALASAATALLWRTWGQRPKAAVILVGSLQYVEVQIATSAKFVKNLGEERFATSHPDSFQNAVGSKLILETDYCKNDKTPVLRSQPHLDLCCTSRKSWAPGIFKLMIEAQLCKLSTALGRRGTCIPQLQSFKENHVIPTAGVTTRLQVDSQGFPTIDAPLPLVIFRRCLLLLINPRKSPAKTPGARQRLHSPWKFTLRTTRTTLPWEFPAAGGLPLKQEGRKPSSTIKHHQSWNSQKTKYSSSHLPIT